jgi:hypothetical protein
MFNYKKMEILYTKYIKIFDYSIKHEYQFIRTTESLSTYRKTNLENLFLEIVIDNYNYFDSIQKGIETNIYFYPFYQSELEELRSDFDKELNNFNEKDQAILSATFERLTLSIPKFFTTVKIGIELNSRSKRGKYHDIFSYQGLIQCLSDANQEIQYRKERESQQLQQQNNQETSRYKKID